MGCLPPSPAYFRCLLSPFPLCLPRWPVPIAFHLFCLLCCPSPCLFELTSVSGSFSLAHLLASQACVDLVFRIHFIYTATVSPAVYLACHGPCLLLSFTPHRPLERQLLDIPMQAQPDRLLRSCQSPPLTQPSLWEMMDEIPSCVTSESPRADCCCPG